MSKRAGLLLTIAAAAALASACSSPATDAPDTSTPGTSTPETATAAATAPPAEARPAKARPAKAKPAVSSDPGDGDLLAGLGTGADWTRFLGRCPDARQKVLVQKVVTGDVNGDGTADAVVGHACSAVTSYWPSEVTVFDGASRASAPKRLGTLLTDVGATDRPYLDKLRVSRGAVVAEAYGVDEFTEAACPSIYYTYRYEWSGRRFERTARDAGNANHCPDLRD